VSASKADLGESGVDDTPRDNAASERGIVFRNRSSAYCRTRAGHGLEEICGRLKASFLVLLSGKNTSP